MQAVLTALGFPAYGSKTAFPPCCVTADILEETLTEKGEVTASVSVIVRIGRFTDVIFRKAGSREKADVRCMNQGVVLRIIVELKI